MLHPFSELTHLSKDKFRAQFGGKALGLYEAHLLNLPIPKTWLISTDIYEAFFLEHKTLDRARDYLENLLKGEYAKLPDTLFAVRSSSQFEDSQAHSYAGIFDSKLHVEKKDLSAAIADVWHSCHSERAASYKERATAVRMGVIVQPMIEAKFAGVCFSKHPSPASVFENEDIIIEYAATSGEQVVQGEITPFRLSGNCENLFATIDTPWIADLLKSIIELKTQYHHEIDIEFVIDFTETFWLVQQRPVSRIHNSHLLDLSDYERKYKRRLFNLDIELLIEGCSEFLAPYLELPFNLERWMVMISNEEGGQELWLNTLLDKSIIFHMSQKILQDRSYLSRIRMRYTNHFEKILSQNYALFFDPKKSLEERFFNWTQFLTPLTAHYYVPMFIIDALHLILKRHMQTIDTAAAEEDLFTLGTSDIASLMEVLENKLHALHPSTEHFDKLDPTTLKKLETLAAEYGFMKCHQVVEEGYSAKDLFEMRRSIEPKEKHRVDHSPLHEKYFAKSPEMAALLTVFKEWLRIRNQEMEFLMYAILHSRPLLQEMCGTLQISLHELWNSSKEMLAQALSLGKAHFVKENASKPMTIYRCRGKTHVSHAIKIKRKSGDTLKHLKGKTIYGQGIVEGIVKRALSVNDLDFTGAKENHILVTGMTTPDYIPHLKKNFSALITDEGGILCHAAIVAREIPIPCIVGTGIGTELLRDGMRVRLHLDSGHIEIL